MVKGKGTFHSIIRDLKNYLEFEKIAGAGDLYGTRPQRTDFPPEGSDHAKNDPPKKKVLEALKNEVLNCTKCPLSQNRRNVVFGAGDPEAKLVFIGEAPGYEEDLQGLPFVGRAGQLLTRIIESIGYKRKDAYICNILKCRPPQNRDPLPSEIFTCQGHLANQLNIIRPKLICALGKFAAQTLLRTDTPITLLRGKFYNYQDIALIPTFHPAYLLRNPKDKRLVWEDMKKIKKFLEDAS